MLQQLQALNGADLSRLPLQFVPLLLAKLLELGSYPSHLVADGRQIGRQSLHQCCCSCCS